MKTFITSIIVSVMLMTAPAVSAVKTTFQDETLKYVLTYKWGLVTKDSGEATLTLRNKGDNYNIRLTGKTKPWADKFYTVRDTLVSVVTKKDFRPKSYTKTAHEGGKYSLDVIDYEYAGSVVGGKVKKHREDSKGNVKQKEFQLTASGETFDMLSVFYWLRTIDVDNLAKGKKLKASLFSGSYSETVTIWKVGEEKLKMRDGAMRDAWHLKFTFTSKGGKKSSDDMDAWISTDSRHIPLKLQGSLPLGKVAAYLISE